MKTMMIFLLLLSANAFSHPNGVYVIDDNKEATLTFKLIKRCPKVPGALRGGLRSLEFSEAAQAQPYNFINGFYVERHTDEEVYTQTDESCVPLEQTNEYPASRQTFNSFTLERKN